MEATATLPETLVPKDGEMQPDFAIRFHESMMDAVPNTDERNRLCFDVWRKHKGDEPEVLAARKYHKAEEYDERRDIPVFCEHEIPARVSKTGKKLPAVRYDKKSLASIAKNMNRKIEDVGRFCPITNGHTSDDPNKPTPEVVGYAGAFRLGMIGNKKPRWALFNDEYHRKDRADVLRHARGRSVEILPVPDVHQREFYPIAVLSADEPRLELPPARYALKTEANGEQVEVERYAMVMPGGNSTFIPSDKYGDEQKDVDLPTGTIRALLTALMQSQPMQWVLSKMEQEGATGGVSPLVHQAPEMAKPELDDVQQGMPAGGSPDASGMPPGGSPPGVPQNTGVLPPATQPKPPLPSGGPAGGGGMPNPQFPPKGKPNMEDQDKYSKIEERLAKLESENQTLRDELNKERAQRIGVSRYSVLAELAREFELNLDKEKDRTASMTDDQFGDHVSVIKEHYRRRPETVADYSAIAGAGRQTDLTGSGEELSKDESDNVVKYAMQHGMDYVEARDRYMADKKAGKIAG